MVENYIQKVLNGDGDAFRFIINDYKNVAFSFAMSVLKDEYLAQEALQISFIKVYSKLHTFKGKSKFSTWLYRIVVNESFKVLKKQKNNFIVFDELAETLAVESDAYKIKDKNDYEKYYINEALKRLKPKESLVLRLFYLEEHSIKEIIDITGWSKSNIKVILHRARVNMKKRMQKYFTNG